jgi:hypothetical protein
MVSGNKMTTNHDLGYINAGRRPSTPLNRTH